jgi:hypothetical protein
MYYNFTRVQLVKELHLKDSGRSIHLPLAQLHGDSLSLCYKADPLLRSTLQTIIPSNKTPYQNIRAAIYPSHYLKAPAETMDLTKEDQDFNIYKVTDLTKDEVELSIDIEFVGGNNLAKDGAELSSDTEFVGGNNLGCKRHE